MTRIKANNPAQTQSAFWPTVHTNDRIQTADDFRQKVIDIRDDGARLNWDIERTTEEIYKLIRAYPDFARANALPVDYPELRAQFVEPAYLKQLGAKANSPKHVQNFVITIIDQPEKNSSILFGGRLVISKGDKILSVPFNTWPNQDSKAPGIRSGSYPAVYSQKGHKKGTLPGARLKDGGKVPTVAPNPAQNGQYYADGINLHCGGQTKRGTVNCITIPKDSCQEVWDFLEEGSVGIITVRREE